eukprot:scaffold231_cov67-Skeletonema_dohrnii-CCMP3373.AAC.1
MTVPSLLRDIACKAVVDERTRTTRLCKKCEDRESDVVKNSDGRMVRVSCVGVGRGVGKSFIYRCDGGGDDCRREPRAMCV